MVKRCAWADNDPSMRDYHDKEWGTPIHDDQLLFEFLILEGAQAGLSWSTILQKRNNFRKAFDNFDYNKITKYSEQKVEELMNKGIINSTISIVKLCRSTISNLSIIFPESANCTDVSSMF